MTTISERQIAMLPADWVSGPKQGGWTYNHYAALPNDGQRYEIVDGVLLCMTPAPSFYHQEIVGEVYWYLVNYVKKRNLGKVVMAPIDVELAPARVVQPDVLVVLTTHLERIRASHIVGAPDLVVEVVSPGSREHDRLTKRRYYAEAGVSEYWIIDPDAKTIEVLSLEGETYQSLGVFSGQSALLSKVVPDIKEVVAQQIFSS